MCHPMVLKFGAIMIVLLLGSIKLYPSYVDNRHISNIVIPSDEFYVLIKIVFEIDSTYILFSQISFKVLVYFSWYIVSFFHLFFLKIYSFNELICRWIRAPDRSNLFHQFFENICVSNLKIYLIYDLTFYNVIWCI